jgi:hypothetical protein
MALYGDVYFPFDPALQGANDLSAVPVERRPGGDGDGHRVLERYRLGESGIVDVVIRDEDSGFERAFRLGKA